MEAAPDGSGTTGTMQISIAQAMVRLCRFDQALTMLLETDDEATVFHSALFRYRATLAEAAAGLDDPETARIHARGRTGPPRRPRSVLTSPGVGRAHADSTKIELLRSLADHSP